MLNNSKNQLKQKIHIVKCNFSSPSKSLEDNQNLKENLKNNKINFLNLWIGDLIKIISFNGEWCFGYRLEEPEKRGIFPSIFVQEMINNNVEENKNVAEKEVGRLAGDISEALKVFFGENNFLRFTLKIRKFSLCLKIFFLIFNMLENLIGYKILNKFWKNERMNEY
ncbi:hypothetical protein ACQ4LE_009467 [Meloidogyne hapla]